MCFDYFQLEIEAVFNSLTMEQDTNFMKIPCQLLNQHIVNKNWVHYFYFYLFFLYLQRNYNMLLACDHADE